VAFHGHSAPDGTAFASETTRPLPDAVTVAEYVRADRLIAYEGDLCHLSAGRNANDASSSDVYSQGSHATICRHNALRSMGFGHTQVTRPRHADALSRYC
jgi:hypothetical protein